MSFLYRGPAGARGREGPKNPEPNFRGGNPRFKLTVHGGVETPRFRVTSLCWLGWHRLKPVLPGRQGAIGDELDAELRGQEASPRVGDGIELHFALAHQTSLDALERGVHVAWMAHQLADAFWNIP